MLSSYVCDLTAHRERGLDMINDDLQSIEVNRDDDEGDVDD